MNTRMAFSPTAPSLTHFYVVLLCFFVVLVSSFLSAQTLFHSDSVVFVSQDSYLYTESSIYISGQNLRKGSFKKWSKTIIKKSPSIVYSKKSISSPTDNTCYKSSPTGQHSLGLLSNSSLMAVIGSPSTVKLQQNIISSSFILLISTRRDKEKCIRISSPPFQIIPITINHFGRPPPLLQS